MGERTDRLASRALLVALWAGATVAAGGLAWSAVARLGQPGATDAHGSLTQSEVRQALVQTSATTYGPTPVLTPTRQPTSTTQPTRATPTATATSGTGPTRLPMTSSPSRAATAPNLRPAAISRTWMRPGGTIGTSCRGSVITMLYATPQDGWTMRVVDVGPVEVSVTFTRRDTDSPFQARCRAGVPTAEPLGDESSDHGD